MFPLCDTYPWWVNLSWDLKIKLLISRLMSDTYYVVNWISFLMLKLQNFLYDAYSFGCWVILQLKILLSSDDPVSSFIHVMIFWFSKSIPWSRKSSRTQVTLSHAIISCTLATDYNFKFVLMLSFFFRWRVKGFCIDAENSSWKVTEINSVPISIKHKSMFWLRIELLSLDNF